LKVAISSFKLESNVNDSGNGKKIHPIKDTVVV
jgi:hypothetical protein